MKRMTCEQLGGACDMEFIVETFEQLEEQSKQHAMMMFAQGDAPHIAAMSKMQHLMTDPKAMQEWMADKRQQFEAQPELEA